VSVVRLAEGKKIPKELETEPRTIIEIADRRNELSLYQELRSIEKIDQLLEEGLLSSEGKYKQIVVRVIELSRSRFSRSLGTASKLNRDPRFIEDLMSYGEARADEFLASLAPPNLCGAPQDVALALRFLGETMGHLSSL
jgi:NTE family protein